MNPSEVALRVYLSMMADKVEGVPMYVLHEALTSETLNEERRAYALKAHGKAVKAARTVAARLMKDLG